MGNPRILISSHSKLQRPLPRDGTLLSALIGVTDDMDLPEFDIETTKIWIRAMRFNVHGS